jgi:TonB family protein
MPCFAQSQQPLCPRHIETPVYAAIARAANVSGKVALRITIDADGSVKDAEATNTDRGVPLLKLGAIDNVRRWTFEKPPFAPYTETLVYDYELSLPLDDTRSTVTFDLPDHVTISSGPMSVEPDQSTRRN